MSYNTITKLCKKCGVEKPLSEMVKGCENNTRDGYRFLCKSCGNKNYRTYRKGYRLTNRDEINHKQRAYRSRLKIPYKLKVCPCCKNEFTPKRKDTKTCSRSCSNRLRASWNYYNNEIYRASNLTASKTAVEILSDKYVAKTLKKMGFNIPSNDRIKEKRECLKLKRIIYEKQRAINTSGNHG